MRCLPPQGRVPVVDRQDSAWWARAADAVVAAALTMRLSAPAIRATPPRGVPLACPPPGSALGRPPGTGATQPHGLPQVNHGHPAMLSGVAQAIFLGDQLSSSRAPHLGAPRGRVARHRYADPRRGDRSHGSGAHAEDGGTLGCPDQTRQTLKSGTHVYSAP
jgi:hypothetical protein